MLLENKENDKDKVEMMKTVQVEFCVCLPYIHGLRYQSEEFPFSPTSLTHTHKHPQS